MIFGYIWFRISKVYRKEDKDGFTGSSFLAFAQALLIAEASISMINHLFGLDSVRLYSRQLGYSAIALMLILIIVNHKLYQTLYDFYHRRWELETKIESFLKGLFVIIFLLLPILIAILNVDLIMK